MEARTRNGSAVSPLSPPEATEVQAEKRWPVAIIVFTKPMEVPGFKIRVTRLIAGTQIMQAGYSELPCPSMWYNPETRFLLIGDRHYPVDGGCVEYFDRARAVTTRKPEPRLKG
jgi:hypothetical protein